MFEVTQEQFINTIRTLKHGGGSIPWQHPVGVFHQRKVHRGWLVLRGKLNGATFENLILITQHLRLPARQEP